MFKDDYIEKLIERTIKCPKNMDNEEIIKLYNEVQDVLKSYKYSREWESTSFSTNVIWKNNHNIINNVLNLNNIIFILPTKSLIEELYIKLLNINKRIDYHEKYNITLNILKHVGKTIRILTPEKFLNYYEYNNLNNIDLIVMDEVYKIENDGRQLVRIE